MVLKDITQLYCLYVDGEEGERERERERETETETETERDRERERERERNGEKGKGRDWDRDKHTKTDRDTHRDRQTDWQTDRLDSAITFRGPCLPFSGGHSSQYRMSYWWGLTSLAGEGICFQASPQKSYCSHRPWQLEKIWEAASLL